MPGNPQKFNKNGYKPKQRFIKRLNYPYFCTDVHNGAQQPHIAGKLALTGLKLLNIFHNMPPECLGIHRSIIHLDMNPKHVL